jgi:hypothetical protein
MSEFNFNQLVLEHLRANNFNETIECFIRECIQMKSPLNEENNNEESSLKKLDQILQDYQVLKLEQKKKEDFLSMFVSPPGSNSTIVESMVLHVHNLLEMYTKTLQSMQPQLQTQPVVAPPKNLVPQKIQPKPLTSHSKKPSPGLFYFFKF